MLKKSFLRLIGLLIFAYILSRVDWERMGNVLKGMEIGWILLAFFLNLPQLWFKAMRWWVLMRQQGLHAGKRKVFLYYLSAVFMGVVTPGRLGELAKTIYLKQNGITTLAHGFSSVVVDRLCDLYLLFLLGAVGIGVLVPWKHSFLIGGGVFITVLASGVFLLLVLKGKGMVYKSYVAPRLPASVKEHLKEFNRGLADILGEILGIAMIFTVCSYAIYFFQCYLIAKALSIPLSYGAIVPVMALTNLFSFLPISVSGLGTRDAALLFLLTPRGIPSEVIIAFSLGILVVFFVGGGLLGMIAWWMEPVSLKTGKMKR